MQSTGSTLLTALLLAPLVVLAALHAA